MIEPTDAELNELADAYTPNTETGSLDLRHVAMLSHYALSTNLRTKS